MFRKSLFAIIMTSLVLTLVACTGDDNKSKEDAVTAPKETGKLVVYVTRKEVFVKPLLEKFTKDTGIKADALYSDSKIINRIIEEKSNVQADLLISQDAGEMEYLRNQGALEASSPKRVETIGAKYRAVDNSWIGLSARSRIFIYNKDKISEADMPKTIWDLADDKYKGKFMITRGGNSSMVAHVSALRKIWGYEKTLQWLKKIKENAGAIVEGHSDIRVPVGAGEFAFGLVNNYYYHLQLAEPTNNNVGAIYPDQGENEIGVFVNAAGVASIKSGPNEASKEKFLDWLLLDENQKEFSFASKEVPLNPNVASVAEAKRINEYKTIDMPLSELGEMWPDTKQMIEKSGLALELKK